MLMDDIRYPVLHQTFLKIKKNNLDCELAAKNVSHVFLDHSVHRWLIQLVWISAADSHMNHTPQRRLSVALDCRPRAVSGPLLSRVSPETS